jgi:hypothetical protein
MDTSLLAPAAVLVSWSLIVLMWTIVTRFPALREAGLDVAKAPAGTRYQEIESGLPDRVNWKSHNYTHLMEQPTLFYATIFILALAGEGTALNLGLAWVYVALRVVHSLWQTLVNTLPVRITLFALSTTALLVLAFNAVLATVL